MSKPRLCSSVGEARCASAAFAARIVWRFAIGGAALALLALTSGCATNALWREDICHAAENPDVALAISPHTNDVLVQYDEQRGDSAKTQRRAYWLFAYSARLGDRQKPAFVDPAKIPDLVPIRILEQPPDRSGPPGGGYIASATPGEQGFQLWRDNTDMGRFYLPVYEEKQKKSFGRILLTPFAAGADTVIVVTVCACVVAGVAAVLYAEYRTGAFQL